MQTKRKFTGLLAQSLYLIWTVLILAILFIIVYRIYAYAEYVASQKAQTSVNKDLAYRNWVASHGGVYVPIDKNTPPNRYLRVVKNRDFHAIGKEFTLMNPAYTLSQMMKNYSKLYGVKTHITSDKVLNPLNKPDAWESLALEKINQTRKPYKELSYIGNSKYLRLMEPLVTKKSCLKCHGFQGYKVNDIRGGVSVSIPMKPLYDDAFVYSSYICGLFLLIWLAGILSIYFFSKKIYTYIDEKEVLYEEYIYGLVSVVEKRDTYTAGHSSRVAHYAEMIARHMGFSEEDCHLLHRAGMLHDIGKVAIPDSVFLKPSALTTEEYKLIQEHVNMSYEMLKNISIFDEIKEIVRDHHEHYDGSGYPRGLLGKDTPMLAQILTLADSFDAITTDRIYKGRKSVKEALEEIKKCSGKQFNPKVVDSALVVLKDVILEDNHHQFPQTLLEKERFSYFYKDALTDLYNEEYIRLDIKNIQDSPEVAWLALHKFHKYNKTHGWNLGDKVLQELANIIKQKCKTSLQVYRFHGDNFLILLHNTQEYETLKTYIDDVLKGKEIEYSFKKSLLKPSQRKKMENLEDILKTLF
jgi:diguanylate cyclase (GGDEF)-like protein/putative nucleotidyltransferase with HDIG domain